MLRGDLHVLVTSFAKLLVKNFISQVDFYKKCKEYYISQTIRDKHGTWKAYDSRGLSGTPRRVSSV